MVWDWSGRDTAAHNLALLAYDLNDVRTVVFSHGHADHHSGLEGITRGLGRSRLPLVLHPPLEHARRLTVTEHVHAFVGGMHLTGGLFEQIIPRTIEALNVIAPDVVVPGNCTGWKAVNTIVGRLLRAYIQSNVGTRLHFAGPPAEETIARGSVSDPAAVDHQRVSVQVVGLG